MSFMSQQWDAVFAYKQTNDYQTSGIDWLYLKIDTSTQRNALPVTKMFPEKFDQVDFLNWNRNEMLR